MDVHILLAGGVPGSCDRHKSISYEVMLFNRLLYDYFTKSAFGSVRTCKKEKSRANFFTVKKYELYNSYIIIY